MLTTETAKRGEMVYIRVSECRVIALRAHPEGLEAMRYEYQFKRVKPRSIERPKPKR